MKIARIGEVDINYEVFGEGIPVLLIMGLGGRGDSWTPLSQALASRGFMAIQYDNRDVGWSSLFTGREYEVSDMAADAVGLLDHLGVEKAHLVGISMGGMIGQEVLLRYPSRIDRAVLMATGPGGRNAVPPPPEVFMALAARDGEPAAMVRTMYTTITAPGFAGANAALIDLAVEAALQKPVAPDAFARQLSAVMRWAAWERLQNITTPTLVIHGDADSLVPHANGVIIAERIPGAKLLTLPGVGHLIPLEAPAATLRAVESFLRSGELPAP